MMARYIITVKLSTEAPDASAAKRIVADLISKGQEGIGKLVIARILSAKQEIVNKTGVR